jgi:hypothetical protein
VIAACFIEKADKKDIELIKKLLYHSYQWIAYKAADKLSKIGENRDLDELTNTLWNLKEEELENSAPAIYCLCMLDKKIYRLT